MRRVPQDQEPAAGSRRRSTGLSDATTARVPAWSAAAIMACAMRSGSGPGMLPKPT